MRREKNAHQLIANPFRTDLDDGGGVLDERVPGFLFNFKLREYSNIVEISCSIAVLRESQCVFNGNPPFAVEFYIIRFRDARRDIPGRISDRMSSSSSVSPFVPFLGHHDR